MSSWGKPPAPWSAEEYREAGRQRAAHGCPREVKVAGLLRTMVERKSEAVRAAVAADPPLSAVARTFLGVPRVDEHLFWTRHFGARPPRYVVRWLAEQHKICVIPGSACGISGALRVCYANLELERCKDAAARLKAGLASLAAGTASVS